MNYELAKELKEAGFPQRGILKTQSTGCPHWGTEEWGTRTDCGCWLSYPTLSELIEACGDDLALMGAATKGWNVWRTGVKYPVVFGTTLEEAVAKLWLKLNKK